MTLYLSILTYIYSAMAYILGNYVKHMLCHSFCLTSFFLCIVSYCICDLSKIVILHYSRTLTLCRASYTSRHTTVSSAILLSNCKWIYWLSRQMQMYSYTKLRTPTNKHTHTQTKKKKRALMRDELKWALSICLSVCLRCSFLS